MIYYKESVINSIDEILGKYSKKEFKSPFRSTIPLLALFKQNLNLNVDLIQHSTDLHSSYIFEYETPVRAGIGLPSCTDLMIINQNSCIAVEAKRTESEYETIEHWLQDSENRMNVLEGWLNYISDVTNVKLI